MTPTLRRVAIVGGVRIPFCRSNTLYADLSNLDMLTATLNGLVERYKLAGVHIDEVVGGAVVTHSRDWNLAREAVLGTKLARSTPGITMIQACGTSLQAAMGIAAKIAIGQIESGIACGSDTTSDAPIVLRKSFAQQLVKGQQAAKTLGGKIKLAMTAAKPAAMVLETPSTAEPRTGLSMGEHCELMAKEWRIPRAEQDELAVASHQKAAEAYRTGWMDDLLVPCAGVFKDNNLREDASVEKMAALRTAFDKTEKGTLTAGNSTPLTDGASSVLLASEEFAQARGLPILAYLVDAQTSANDFAAGEGLLMAPTIAVSRLLDRQGMRLQDFATYEIHEAFAAQVLCNVAAIEDEAFVREKAGVAASLGKFPWERFNPNGGSVAIGHPFGATGARILSQAVKELAALGPGKRAVVSICADGGLGTVALLESA